MFLRFPEIVPGYNQSKTLAIDKIPYALFSVEKDEGKKTVFLTEHTLIFILNGEKKIYLTDETLHIDSNKIVFLKRGIYAMSEYFPKGEKLEALLIFIPDNFLKKFLFGKKSNSSQQNEQSSLIITSNDLLDSFKNHYKNYFGKNLSSLQYILDIKMQELFLLLTASSNNTNVINFISSLIYNNSVDLDFIIQKHLFQPITIPELAKLSGRSTASFKRDFEIQFATSPRKWINQQRLKQARLLLNNTSRNINEIALECGYESVSHFIRIFKTEFGETPSQTRKETTMP